MTGGPISLMLQKKKKRKIPHPFIKIAILASQMSHRSSKPRTVRKRQLKVFRFVMRLQKLGDLIGIGKPRKRLRQKYITGLMKYK